VFLKKQEKTYNMKKNLYKKLGAKSQKKKKKKTQLMIFLGLNVEREILRTHHNFKIERKIGASDSFSFNL